MSPGVFMLIGPCGALGAIARWWIDTRLRDRVAPGWGIGIVNVLACLAAGLASVLPGGAATVVAVGFLGGLSTFSTAMVDVVKKAAAPCAPSLFSSACMP